MEGVDKDAFMAGIELGIDWNLYIPPEDIALYRQLIEERRQQMEPVPEENSAAIKPYERKPDGSRT